MRCIVIEWSTTVTMMTIVAMMLPVGCSQTQDPTDDDYDDVATAVGALIAPSNAEGGEIGSMDDAASLALGESGDLSTTGRGGFEGTVAGLTYSYSVTCTDAGGAARQPCDKSTDWAMVQVDWSGALNLSNYQASVVRTGEWTVSGLQGDTAKFSGTAAFSVKTAFQAMFRDVERTFTLDYGAKYNGVAWRRSDKRLLAGEIEYTVHAQRTSGGDSSDAEVELDVIVNVAFDGSGTADVTLDGDRTYRLDVGSGQLTKN